MKSKPIIKFVCLFGIITASLYGFWLTSCADTNSSSPKLEDESTNAPVKLQSSPTTVTPPVTATPPVPVYILPATQVVFTPQGRFLVISEHHFNELRKLGFQAFTVTNIIIYNK